MQQLDTHISLSIIGICIQSEELQTDARGNSLPLSYDVNIKGKVAMITVYLDSQDYSNLTDPKQLTPALNATRDSLLAYARAGTVRFLFSSVAICEFVPLSSESVHLAAKKAEFLSDLCGTNALVSFDRLISMEINALFGNAGGSVDPIDPQGTWFPDLAPLDEEMSVWQRMQGMVGADLIQQGLPRKQRRAISRKLVKRGQPCAALRSLLEKHDSRSTAAAIIEKYPMRPEQADLIAQYVLGRVSEVQFRQALVESLRDPRWMMQWFATTHSLAGPIAEIVRRPGRELGEQMRILAKISLDYIVALSALNPTGPSPTGRHGDMTKKWSEFQDRQLVNIVCTLAQGKFNTDLPDISTSQVSKCCIGLATTLGSLYSSVWENVGGGRKELPSDSQFVDALHALYAPYVDIFRADRFMAPHILKQVATHGTTVVPRLPLLVEAIEKRLSQNT